MKRAIYLDVDMIFSEDIGILWNHFSEMDSDKDLLLFMGDNHPTAYGPRARYPFCSCQLIMDLEKLRTANLTHVLKKEYLEINSPIFLLILLNNETLYGYCFFFGTTFKFDFGQGFLNSKYFHLV